ncbi:unnamed protein product [Caenorhabditis angaria]|uniref:Uncharacterized protein n=1 Tax=Caenorhabditis angaria TaxID=860376 RepID=A0A9P1J262_9PELO|nr:unnamed protein product [Caenorhabditis angaria]
MSMQFTGLQVVSWILLLLGTGVLTISLISDYWSTHIPHDHHENLSMNRGLLRQCIRTSSYSNCNFRLASIFKHLKETFKLDGDLMSARTIYRHKPTQSFEIFVALFIVIACLVAGTVLLFGPFCCQKCKASTTLLIFITGVFSGSGCLVYWNSNREGHTFTLVQSSYSQEYFNFEYSGDINNLSWSFYMACTSTVIILISAFLLCVSSRVDPDVEYEPAVTSV